MATNHKNSPNNSLHKRQRQVSYFKLIPKVLIKDVLLVIEVIETGKGRIGEIVCSPRDWGNDTKLQEAIKSISKAKKEGRTATWVK